MKKIVSINGSGEGNKYGIQEGNKGNSEHKEEGRTVRNNGAILQSVICGKHSYFCHNWRTKHQKTVNDIIVTKHARLL